MDRISNIQIINVRPTNNIVAFVTFMWDNVFYMSHIALCTRPDGSYYLSYPSKISSKGKASIFNPCDKNTAQSIEKVVVEKYKESVAGMLSE